MAGGKVVIPAWKRQVIETIKAEKGFENKKTAVLPVIADEISYLLGPGGRRVPDVVDWIREEIGVSIHKKSLYRWVSENTELLERDGEDSAVIAAVINFKGGVGKSTISNLVEPDGRRKIVVNLDKVQSAEEVNGAETVDFQRVLDESDFEDLREFLEHLKGEYDLIVLDTPGDIGEFVSVVDMVNVFILPFMPGDRSEKTTKTTYEVIAGVLSDMIPDAERRDVWLVVLNNYHFEEELAELDEMREEVEKTVGRPTYAASLKHSKAIKTLERKRATPAQLAKENVAAYMSINRNTDNLNSTVLKALSAVGKE